VTVAQRVKADPLRVRPPLPFLAWIHPISDHKTNPYIVKPIKGSVPRSTCRAMRPCGRARQLVSAGRTLPIMPV